MIAIRLAGVSAVVLGISAFSATADDKDAAKADQAQLQGEWTMVSGSADGQAMPDAFLTTAKRVCTGDETTVHIGGQLIMKAKFTLDATQKPKTIDYLALDGLTKGKKHLGIYELAGDQVKFCFGSPDAERPKDFASNPGDGRTLSVWKRAAAPEKNEKK
jgi:uncharacterized protein (TIGR03067 family)